MGERAHQLNAGPTALGPLEPIEPEPRQIEREIEALRAQLDALVEELDRRRHEAFDLRRQLRRHPGALAAGAAVLLGGLVLAARSRRPPPLAERIGTVLRGVYALGEDPERLERAAPGMPALAAQLARTAALAGATVLVRRLTLRALGG